MSFYQKYMLIACLIGLVGIPVFVLDTADLSWAGNREVYWGMIALVAILVYIIAQYLADKKLKNMKK
jgi:drug/metabolite transporter (DMT)-like permease